MNLNQNLIKINRTYCTRSIYRFLIKILILFLVSHLASAENGHDHLPSLPLATDFAVISEDIFNLPTEYQKVNKLFHNYKQFIHLIITNFEIDNWKASHLITSKQFYSGNLTLNELCSSITENKIDSLMKLLKIDPKNVLNKTDARELYLTVEMLRRKLLLALPKESISKIFNSYFATDLMDNRDIIDLTVPREFLYPDQIEKVISISSIAVKYGSKIKFFASIQRTKVDFSSIEMITQLIEGPYGSLISGIDLTSSILESIHPNVNLDLDSNLQSVFDFCSVNNLELRIHAFEGANKGVFYDEIESIIKNYDQKLNLHIGHLNKINPKWLRILSSNKNLNVSFDVNAASNLFLQDDTSLPHLVKHIEMVEKFGFKVRIGADGRGILSNSSFIESLDLLDPEHLNRFEFQKNNLQMNCSNLFIKQISN